VPSTRLAAGLASELKTDKKVLTGEDFPEFAAGLFNKTIFNIEEMT
jgi:hypothetical protein